MSFLMSSFICHDLISFMAKLPSGRLVMCWWRLCLGRAAGTAQDLPSTPAGPHLAFLSGRGDLQAFPRTHLASGPLPPQTARLTPCRTLATSGLTAVTPTQPASPAGGHSSPASAPLASVEMDAPATVRPWVLPWGGGADRWGGVRTLDARCWGRGGSEL